MSGIFWTSSSISNYFNTSLNQSTSGLNSLYGSLSDAAMIKSGSYKKLMRSYVNELKSQSSDDSDSDKKSSSEKTDVSKNTASAYDKNGKKTGAAIKNTVLDELLSHKEYKSKSSNKYLNELFAKKEEEAKKEAEAKKAADGTVTVKDDTAASDTASAAADSAASTAGTANISEATAGAIIDESV